jgi:hypothetical protein
MSYNINNLPVFRIDDQKLDSSINAARKAIELGVSHFDSL